MKQFFLATLSSILLIATSCASIADGEHPLAGNVKGINPSTHAPMGVMADHMHKQGEWMISYRYMNMEMEGLLNGSDSISANDAVTTLANPYAPPSTVRVIPLNMQNQMHMVGMMYAPSNNITIMGMLSYVEKNLQAQTYMGMTGTTVLGTFNTESSGMGDSKIAMLWRLYERNGHHAHINLGLNIPTGRIDNKDTVLTPMNTRIKMRLPYSMQPGSGTYHLEPGITYTGHQNDLGWGAQYKAVVHLGRNSEGYALGDAQQLTGWSSYRLTPSASGSLRLAYTNTADIKGYDRHITSPTPAANPENYGREQLDLGIGINLVGQHGILRGHRLGLEYIFPLYQQVNGVQMDMQNMLTVGYQFAW